MLSLERSSEVQREVVVKPHPVLEGVRNRLRTHGVRSLTDTELLVLLIRHGDAKHNVMDIANTLYTNAPDHLFGLGQYDQAELADMPGMNKNKASALVAAFELGRRRATVDRRERALVCSSASAYELLRPVLTDLHHEEFWLILLDRGNRLIVRERMSIGGMHGTVADPKLIFHLALQRKASCIVVAHNHPSGQLRPSEEDIRLTRKLVEGGKLLDIAVQDHVIVTDTGYYSFADQGQMH